MNLNFKIVNNSIEEFNNEQTNKNEHFIKVTQEHFSSWGSLWRDDFCQFHYIL